MGGAPWLAIPWLVGPIVPAQPVLRGALVRSVVASDGSRRHTARTSAAGLLGPSHRFGASVTFAQLGIIAFDGQIEPEALRLCGLPEHAPAILRD